MRIPPWTPAALAAIALIAAGGHAPAQAQSLKCKNDFSQLGDSKVAILQKCGEPMHRDAFCKPGGAVFATPPGQSPVGNLQSCETVDEWTYNPGYGQFMTTLRFESGMLTAVRYGDRVR